MFNYVRHVHGERIEACAYLERKKCAAIRSLLRVEKLMAAFDCTNSTARGMREREKKRRGWEEEEARWETWT